VSPAPLPAPGPDGDDPPRPRDAARDGSGPGAPAPDGLGADGAAADGPAAHGHDGPAQDGPDGPAWRAFEQDQAADTMAPGPELAALAEQAAADLGGLSDDGVLGLVSAARRLANRAEYLELAAVAEFTARRQGQLEAARARKDPPGQRAGEFADAELAMHLLVSGREAGDRMDQATALATRLPRTFAGLGDGVIDAARAYAIWYYTRFLSDADAGHADAVLAAAAPGVRAATLARKAAALEMKLDPAAAKARKEHARKDGRRVEARREPSGNMSFGARELAVEEALAASAAVEADAAALRRAGADGSLRDLRVRCFLDRLSGRNPLDRLPRPPAATTSPDAANPGHDDSPGPESNSTPGPGTGGSPGNPVPDGASSPGPGTCTCTGDSRGTPDVPASGTGPGTDPGTDAPEPFPALINLLVPAGTMLGWSTAPGEAGRWGLLDPDDTRRLVQAASKHPRTRWCVTAVAPDGTAAAHGCSRGPHPWTPPPPASTTRPSTTRPSTTRPSPATRPPPGPDAHQQAQLTDLLRALNITLAPIAKGTCDHRHREDRYQPSRRLGHLIRARTATCPAPGCGAQAYHADLDHTTAVRHEVAHIE
jgi:hypothetical protein